jgi:dihydroxyacid dehydratase/phosphogluconate dehydratase
LAPSGEEVWLELGRRSAIAVRRLRALDLTLADILTSAAIDNAMLVHAAFGGSTNLLLHIAAIAHAAGAASANRRRLEPVNRATPRLVDALPNGPRGHPTAQVFMAGGVPEVLLHLRRLGLIDGRARTVTGDSVDTTLDWWEESESPSRSARTARRVSGDLARRRRHESGCGTTRRTHQHGRLSEREPGSRGAVIKSTAIDASVIGEDGVYRHRGPARVFTDERDAIAAVKGTTDRPIREGDVIVLMGMGHPGRACRRPRRSRRHCGICPGAST